MKNIILVTDTGADLSPEMIEKYEINIVNMHINLGAQSFSDLEIEVKDIFDYYKKTKSLAQTSGSNPYDVDQVLGKIRKESNNPIVYVTTSKDLSISNRSAHIGAENYKDVHIIDSESVSFGSGILVLSLGKYLEENPEAKVSDLLAYGEEIKKKTRLMALPETLDFLLAGGRLSKAQHLGATLLKIHPLLEIEDGKIYANKKYRGSFRRAIIKALEDFFRDNNIDMNDVYLIKSLGLGDREVHFIEEALRVFGLRDYKWIQAGPLISTHCGPGLFGLVALEK